MRAPRWFREFCAWRWAPCFALIAGALAFIVLVLLLVPEQLETATRVADAARSMSAPEAAPRRAIVDVPAEATVGAVALRGSAAAFARPPAPAPQPLPETDETARVAPPDYASNITARADRPTWPALHSPL